MAEYQIIKKLQEGMSAKQHYKAVMQKTIVPMVDPRKYPKRPGLEGPFRNRKGLVYYYDPKEGEYYDPSTDMYLDISDVLD